MALGGFFGFTQEQRELLQLLLLLFLFQFVAEFARLLGGGLARALLGLRRRGRKKEEEAAEVERLRREVGEVAFGDPPAADPECELVWLGPGAVLRVCRSSRSGRYWLQNAGERPLILARGSRRFPLGRRQVAAWSPKVPPVIIDPVTGARYTPRRE